MSIVQAAALLRAPLAQRPCHTGRSRTNGMAHTANPVFQGALAPKIKGGAQAKNFKHMTILAVAAGGDDREPSSRRAGVKHVLDIERNLGRIEEEVGGIRSGLDRINESLQCLEAVSGRLKECEDELRITREGIPPRPRIGKSPAVSEILRRARASSTAEKRSLRPDTAAPMPDKCPVELEGRNGYAAMVLCRMGYPEEYTVAAMDLPSESLVDVDEEYPGSDFEHN